MGGSETTLLMPSSGGDGRARRLPASASSRCPMPEASLYHRPVIGILSHPGDGASGRLNNATGVSNIPASYIKFVESAGARVIPLIYNEPEEVLLNKLSLVNGVLFTGGWAKKGLYFETIKKIFQITLARNDGGDHFPLLAICLGFELLSMIISKDNNICERFNSEDHASTLHFPSDAEIEGSLFERFPLKLRRKLSTDCLAMQNHKKNAFEWGAPTIPHSEDAVRVTQLVANYFISTLS